MEIPGMNPEAREMMDRWCQWCVAHKTYIQFGEWVRYSHSNEDLKAIIAVFNPSVLQSTSDDEFFIRICLRGTDKYIGLKNPTYALVKDGSHRAVVKDAHWFVQKNRAKAWTNLSSLRKFCGMATGGKWSDATFSKYVAVLADGTTKSLEEVLKGN